MSRLSATLVIVAAALLAGGCSSATSVSFTNVSDTWLNVTFFASDQNPTPSGMETPTAHDDPKAFVGTHMIQIQPGATETYSLSKITNYRTFNMPLVHVQVTPVRPSWVDSGPDYWLEMLTDPPVTIVATGPADALSFIGGEGAVAVIPPDRMSTFRHGYAGVPVESSRQP